MKTIKPQKLGLLHKSFEDGEKSFFAVTLLVCFPFDPPGALLSEVGMWKFLSAELGKNVVFDLCMPKSRGELLLAAHAHPPSGTASVCQVRVQLGPLDKSLRVVGNRRWEVRGMSEPEPFTQLPIAYEHAFGGVGYKLNPLGKGYAPVRTAAGEIHPLPNIEDPRALIESPQDLVPPAGFGPYDFMWPQRHEKVGTYDKRWLTKRFPGYAEDMDSAIWNAAPADQQIGGYFRGDEPFVLENLHPRRSFIESRLPSVATRCFINQKTTSGEVFREIDTRLDTIWLFPHAERGILVFRGVTQVMEDDAADVLQVVVGCEDMVSPKPAEHYQSVLAQRLDRGKAHLVALQDGDLLPPSREGQPQVVEPSDMDGLMAREGLLQQNMRRRLEREREQARQKLIAHGLDPDEHDLPALSPPESLLPQNPEEIGDYIGRAKVQLEEKKAELEARRMRTEQALRKECEKQGINYEEALAQRTSGGPPRFSAEQELRRLRDVAEIARNRGEPDARLEAALADPAFTERLRATEQQQRASYQKHAHHYPAAGSLSADESARIRQAAQAAHAAGQSLAARDLTGADLSQLNFTGADFRGALMEGVSLVGADLSRAELSGAVLARADLSNANLMAAKLAGTNFGAAKLVATRLDGADLTAAVLYKADLSSASLRGAMLDRANLMEANLRGTDFRDVKAEGMRFLKSDLSDIRADGADFTKALFIEAAVAKASFSGTTLTSAMFLGTRGDGACFHGATLKNLRVVRESSFAGADFTGADLERANFRGTNLAGSDFSNTVLNSADLSECNLQGAKLYRARAREALFIRADLTDANMIAMDLMLAILQKASLCGANLRGANLFRADLSKARGDERTNFQDANLMQTRMVTQDANAKG